jgi:23S rRNA (guanosine2251-2'-O)-methyltransferase
VRELYVDAKRDDTRMRDLVSLAQAAGVEARRVEATRLDRMCPQRTHQGVVAFVTAQPATLGLDELLDRIEGPPLLLLLDGVTDPRNLGACLRVADGAGVHGVIAPKDHACPLNETAIRTASGAADTVPYVMVTNLARTIDTLEERHITVMGAADEATQTLYQADIPAAVAWVLGAVPKFSLIKAAPTGAGMSVTLSKVALQSWLAVLLLPVAVRPIWVVSLSMVMAVGLPMAVQTLPSLE